MFKYHEHTNIYKYTCITKLKGFSVYICIKKFVHSNYVLSERILEINMLAIHVIIYQSFLPYVRRTNLCVIFTKKKKKKKKKCQNRAQVTGDVKLNEL